MALRQAAKLYPFRGHQLQTAPASEPVTAADLRTHLRETEAGLPAAEANSFITSARTMIEEMTGLALITQSWRLVYDRWPGTREVWWDGVRDGALNELYGAAADVAIMLPRYPLQSVSGVSVFAEDNSETVVDVAATFYVDTYQKPGRIALQYGKTWPIAMRPTNGVQIDYVAGYGAAAPSVPEPLRQAVKVGAAMLYTNRGDGCAPGDMMAAVGPLVQAYRAARL